MRSNCVNLRTCPAAMFFLEGLSKLLMLMLITEVCINTYDQNNFVDHNEKSRVEYFVLIMLVASLLHEAGEIQEANFELGHYFGVEEFCLSVACFCFSSCDRQYFFV